MAWIFVISMRGLTLPQRKNPSAEFTIMKRVKSDRPGITDRDQHDGSHETTPEIMECLTVHAKRHTAIVDAK
jgi:hypothetical protein